MAYEAEGRKIAAELAAQFGKLLEVRLEAKYPSRIVLVYKTQEVTLPNEFIFKFGYSGSGTDCLHAFLEASGFSIPKKEVETAQEGDILQR